MAENYILLERTELNAAVAEVTFSNIPQTGYTDLKIVVSARLASGTGFMLLDFNGLSTANFSHRVLEGNGASAYSFVSGNTNYATGLVGGGDTANTFTNVEFYIPNYAGSTFKSVSIDGVTENNGTTAYADLEALLWSNTAAISQFKLTTSSAVNFAAGSTFSLYGIAALGTTPAIAPKASGGNRIDNDGTYWYHTFTSSGSFVPQTGITADVLVVAGGGGGSYYHGSGAGAGGLLTFTSQALTSTTYNCTVGAGGSGATSGSANTGNDSQFGALTLVKGGGGGVVYDVGNGVTGGSGSGATSSSVNRTGGSPTSGQGFAGGDVTGGLTGFYPNAGGGGAGAVGGSITSGSQAGGSGGIGLTNATLNAFGAATTTGQLSSGNYYYAGGGGAGSFGGGGAGAGGLGGGGAGSAGTGTAGTVNTGGGGGAGGSINPANLGGAGGSGIIIVRYPIAS
jgi:hypothetical protein